MSLDRTNMVSLLDIGSLNGGTAENLVEMGDGFTELTEDWGPDVSSVQYVNMKTKASTLKGYDFSMTPEREHLSDEMQTTINTLFKEFPTGEKAESYYYRFYKIDMKSASGDCIRVPVVVSPSSSGGSGGDPLTSSIQLNGNGDVEQGTITLADGKYTWTAKATT